jgi:hypothetical protein
MSEGGKTLYCTLCCGELLGASYITYAPGQRAYFCHPVTPQDRDRYLGGSFSCLELIAHASRGTTPPVECNRLRLRAAQEWVTTNKVDWL